MCIDKQFPRPQISEKHHPSWEISWVSSPISHLLQQYLPTRRNGGSPTTTMMIFTVVSSKADECQTNKISQDQGITRGIMSLQFIPSVLPSYLYVLGVTLVMMIPKFAIHQSCSRGLSPSAYTTLPGCCCCFLAANLH